MAIPVPNVIGSPILLNDPPAGGTVSLSCTPIAGASYQWTLFEQPDGGTAALTNATTSTPTLTGVTLRGTYLVFLKVTNSFGSSHAQPYPTQNTTAPYDFSSPLTSAFAVVRVKEESGLIKPGRGEYGWFETGLWPLVDAVGAGLSFSYYTEATRTLTANAIVPDDSVTPFDDIVSIAGLNVRDDAANSEHELYNSYDKINVLSNLQVTGKDLTVSGGIVRADEIRDASGGDIVVAANANLVVTASTVDVTADYGITLDMAGALSETLALTSNGNVLLRADNALQIQAQEDGTISLTTNNGLISAYGSNIALEADADVEVRVGSTTIISTSSDIALNATDDITLTAVDDINLNSTGASGSIKLNATGTNGEIVLEPTIETTTTKPLRAPGLVVCDTTQYKSDTTFPAGNLFPDVPEYTRYSVGSELDTTIAVAAYAPKLATIELLLKRTVGVTTSTLATISTGALAEAGVVLFNIRCSTKITKDGLTLTVLSYDKTDPTVLDTPTTPGATTTTYTLRSETFTGPVSFQVYSSNELAQFSAQMTCALYNPHDQDVI